MRVTDIAMSPFLAISDFSHAEGLLQGWSRRVCGDCAHNGLEFDASQSTRCILPAWPVVGPLDPDGDRDSELFPGDSGAAIEEVLLRQGEEALHGYRGIALA